jgi:RND family efflux transporter MFP subunit
MPEVESEQLKLFLTGRKIYATFYDLKESEARLAKYTIRAPFDGALTETYINRSSLVRVGQQLGEFISYDDYELEASINVEDLRYFEIGSKVTFTDVRGIAEYVGTLVRINNKVDPNSQLVKVFFQIKDQSLRSGLYLQGTLNAKAYENAMRVTFEALVDASSVFLIEEGTAVLQPVEVLEKTPNEAIISGLKEGAKLILDNKNSAFAGSSVIEMTK